MCWKQYTYPFSFSLPILSSTKRVCKLFLGCSWFLEFARIFANFFLYFSFHGYFVVLAIIFTLYLLLFINSVIFRKHAAKYQTLFASFTESKFRKKWIMVSRADCALLWCTKRSILRKFHSLTMGSLSYTCFKRIMSNIYNRN